MIERYAECNGDLYRMTIDENEFYRYYIHDVETLDGDNPVFTQMRLEQSYERN